MAGKTSSSSIPQNKFPFSVATPFSTRFVRFRNLTSAEAASVPRTKPPMYYATATTQCTLFTDFCKQHGFRPLDQKANPGTDYNLIWIGGHVPAESLAKMSPYQRVNHHPSSSNLTKKDKLWTNVSRMNQVFPGEFDFLPKTYRLPQDHLAMKKDAAKEKVLKVGENLKTAWIVKPTTLSRGRGIHLKKSLGSIDYSPTQEKPSQVVSQYIANPLLIDGVKFDMRLYVVVTSTNPLKIYLNDEGLVRFSTEKYDMTEEGLENNFKHLTNYSINRANKEKYIKNTSEDGDGVGHKWSLSAFKDYLNKKNISADEVMSSIEDLVVKTVISANRLMSDAFFEHVLYRRNCFELFGFDVLLDETLKPWLLEVNLSPSMGHASPLDLKVKSTLMKDIYNTVGVRVPRLDLPEGSEEEKQFNEFHKTYPESSLNTNYAKILIKEFQRELTNQGGLKCLYPNHDSEKYEKYFEVERPFNQVLIDYRKREVNRLNFKLQQENWVEITKKRIAEKDQTVSEPTVPLVAPEAATLQGSS